MDRALAPTHLAAAFGVSLPKHLPGPDELGKLIADLEVQLVAGIANSGFRIDLSPIRKSAWYLHGIASTSDPARYPAEQRRRAFAVSSHVLDVLLEDPRASHRSRLVTAFAAQVGYHHADESPNATAVHRKLHLNLAEPAHFTEGAGVVLQAGIHFLALDTRTLSRHLGTWSRQVTELASAAELDTLDGTMFGPTERVLRGISDLAAFLREGDFELLDNARSHLLRVVQDDVGLSDLDTRW